METALLIALIQIGAQIGPPFIAWLIQFFQANPAALASFTPEQIQALKGNLKDPESYFK